ncbi:MAG: LysR family transcriptional regulator [Alphaproteobacteria bacterium]|nr:LysR family transcriptional regulator [Alphaproteobacteria bacterium]MAS48821.1 LysR family transcriptional regulator [Alphaproteobacteria bacterium]MAX94314.1 LysR family transcriptional regulator [Alphaproteobacteria bacterium]MBN52791.1 LysR family transcriptional regulator [Alphaproteobacteria bacterium]OUT39442.1 MAG: LysR family transcriptional regulator [Micavibrio sp. TMED2]|tara:strand:+ start:16590 stop:17465 length:876 start_codon:yes stop_codon:yes gene_type:complete
MSKLNYNHLRYFRAVAREGNLTRAAEQLNLSQSALSVQIRKLEEQLGQELFERRGRQLHLTEAGRVTLDYADTIFTAGEELIGTLNTTGGNRKALRIGALATLSRNFQIGFLEPILDRPDVEIILRSGGPVELHQALASLSLDVILTNQPPANDAITPFVTHRLAEQRVSLIGLPDQVQPINDLPALLATRPLILPTRETSLRVGFDALADRLDIRPQIAAEVDDMAMMRLLTREGIGLAVMPPIVVKDELESGYLVEAARLTDIAETFYAITIERKFPNPLVKELLAASA